MNLQEFFAENPRVAIAFSGGVDSSYLLYAALHYGARARAYYVNSAFQPAFELEDARRLAGELNADMKVLPVDVLASETVTANPPGRSPASSEALVPSSSTVKPSASAAAKMVRSPLRECGLTKRDVRMLSRDAGLFTWDKPAYACLATRIPTGQPITARDLAVTEAAERDLFSLGFTDFRVRMVGRSAKIQLPAAQMPRLLEHRQEILQRLGPDYDGVWLDLEGRG